MRFLRLLAAAVLLASTPALAQKACTKADADAAAKAADRASTWATLHGTWKSYRHCDTGEVADLLTEALLRLIVDWKNVDQLATAMKDPEYEDFVISHLRSPAAKNDIEDVYSRAKRSCPPALSAWCSSLAAAIDAAPPKPIVVKPAAPPASASEKK